MFSILPVISPVSPMLSVMMPSWLMRRSRSFSCSLRTFIMKSSASKASSLLGLLDMWLSPCACIVKGLLDR